MKTISITKLKAQISARIREVRSGRTYLVTDRDQVVAKLSPPEPEVGLVIRPPLRAKPNYTNRLAITVAVDPAELLAEDRARGAY